MFHKDGKTKQFGGPSVDPLQSSNVYFKVSQ